MAIDTVVNKGTLMGEIEEKIGEVLTPFLKDFVNADISQKDIDKVLYLSKTNTSHMIKIHILDKLK